MEFVLIQSSNPKKKWMVKYINQKTGREKTLHFGAKDYEDYTIHKDPDRKDRYIQRHSEREDWNDLTKAGAWSRYILWGEKTLKGSIKAMEKRFKIKIIHM